MKIEELHEILKNKYKKCVEKIEEVDLGFGPSYKQFFIIKKDLITRIAQMGKKKCFGVYIMDNNTGDVVTISTKMDGSKVDGLVNLIL